MIKFVCLGIKNSWGTTHQLKKNKINGVIKKIVKSISLYVKLILKFFHLIIPLLFFLILFQSHLLLYIIKPSIYL